MKSIFYNCNSLTEIDVSDWDTSNVTNMGSIFYNCSALTEIDVSNWNTSKVTTLFSTFEGCKNLTEIDVSRFDTKNVTNMSSVFSGCSNLSEIDVSKWNTSNVTSMSAMFQNCSNLVDLDLSESDTGNVTNMVNMFFHCYNLTTTIPILGNVANYTIMFYNAATQNGAKITVNYTQEISSLVDNMIATKSSNSNLVKGSQVTVPISLMSLFSEKEIVATDEADISVTKVDENSIYLNVNDLDGISKINLLNENNEIVDEITVDGDTLYKNLVNIENEVIYVQVVDMNNVKTSISV